MENIFTFIPEHLVILVAATYVLGIFLKRAKDFNDNKITVALMLFSITFSILLTLINAEYKRLFDAVVTAILQGILCWGAAVGVNQTIKQAKKSE